MRKTESRRESDETLDLQQAADYCHLGLESMKALVASGEVPAWSENQKHTVVHIEDLRAFVRDRARKQAQERRDAAQTSALPPQAPRVGKRRGRRASTGAAPSLDAYEVAEPNGRRPAAVAS